MDMTFTTSVMDATGTITTGTCTLGDIASWTRVLPPTPSPARTRPAISR